MPDKTNRRSRLARLFAIPFAAALAASCAGVATTPPADAPAPAIAVDAQSGLPPFEQLLAASDLKPDPEVRFGRLANGLSYAIRHNETPQGTAEVRLHYDAGSFDEAGPEQGFAHFVEHMAFNGSTNVPEGEMVALLERKGLEFGADTNASTGFDGTLYQLSLPTNDAPLLDTALMLMRETASELLFTPEAVEREKGIILSERRDRNTYTFADVVDRLAFESPDVPYADRMPIGTLETIEGATSEGLRAFWARNYRPERAVLTVVGDYPADEVEAAIRKHFASWQAHTPTVPDRNYGRIDNARKPAVDIFLNPALSERVSATRQGEAQLAPDTLETRQTEALRWLGYAIVNRRMKRLARLEDPPFKSAGFGTADIFRVGRVTRLVVDTSEGTWKRGMDAAVAEYRRALAGGFSQAEVDEQLGRLIAAYEDAAAGEATRTNRAITSDVLDLFEDGDIPTLASDSLAQLLALKDTFTPDAVLAALQDEAVPLDNAMLRYSGRSEPEGGATALRSAWNAAMQAPLGDVTPPAVEEFGYTDFGTPGTVVADSRDPVFGIREVTFANNVRLNIKRTDLEADRVRVRIHVDGGQLLDTKQDPLVTELIGQIPAGGLGKHSADDLDTILAGRNVGVGLSAYGDAVVSTRTTTPRDLGLQLELFSAFLTDPGLRPEAIAAYRRSLPDRFARQEATPGASVGTHQFEIISDGDPRYTIQPIAAYQSLDFATYDRIVEDRFENGAIEIGIVGDIEEDAAIALVARTLGALPVREPDFRGRPEARKRSFTARRGPVFVRHGGEADQAMIRAFYPTTDDSDPLLTARLELLEKVGQVVLNDELRERLGQAYSPGVTSSMSRTYPDFGFFVITVGVDTAAVPASLAAIHNSMRQLRDAPVSDDLLLRARQPLLDQYDNALKNNAGWLSLVDRAQSRADRLARFAEYRNRIASITPADLQSVARRWLPDGGAVEIIAIPQGATEPDVK
ncbi:M16 family metallopeptidase [Croceicoccus bisphenolivorans]|uniref:M16 family metallopeptidase n=1 Tax=Croceicoccus bisphenolivorans TaxID=1783232 RepID=UPI00082E852D|nr:insulinase family protein [Croceicoccus bisphenolivorans]